MALIDLGKGLREQNDALLVERAILTDRIDLASSRLRTLIIRTRASLAVDITPTLRNELVDLALDVQSALQTPAPTPPADTTGEQ